jgi:putative thiamine transport system ATP-binding protein
MSLKIENLSITVGEKKIISQFSAEVKSGEVLAIMGASGSGKTSLLSAIAGDLPLPLQTTGQVFLNDHNLNYVPPELRRIGRLFQDDLLFPHLTVGENLMFGMARGPRLEREAIMKTALERLELQGFEGRAPQTLSGGQRSRVALMRSLLAKPDAILLDEPFSKLDRSLRSTIRDYTFLHVQARGIATLLVTHDLDDVPAGAQIIYV